MRKLLILAVVMVASTLLMGAWFERVRMQQETSTEFTNRNPTLPEGVIGYETDTRKWKMGDGNSAWSSLAYSSLAPSATGSFTQSMISDMTSSSTVTFAGVNATGTVSAATVTASSIITGGTLTAATLVSTASGTPTRGTCWKADGKTMGWCSGLISAACGTCN